MYKKLCILAVMVSIALTSCAPAAFIGGAALGLGGYKYYDGKLVVIYPVSLEKTFDASISAMENLEYQIYERQRKLTSGKIVTTGSIKDQIKLHFKYNSIEETEVTIRVGLMGDESVSNKIKDKISENLFNK
ncbi:MAG: DUF3568 family protein [Deltaproteobacteria bacterium]|nr:DUF3568 family protein [Deltaproteobacteria bacterium]